VEQVDVRADFLRLLERFLTAPSGNDAKPLVVERQRHELGDPWLVIGDEHGRLTVQIAEPPGSSLASGKRFPSLTASTNTLQLQWLFQFVPSFAARDNRRATLLLHNAGSAERAKN